MSGIVHILPLSDLMAALMGAFSKHGRKPSRVVACRVQIARWEDDLGAISRIMAAPRQPHVLNIMGVPIVEGPDAPAEMIWSEPIDGAATEKAA